MMMRKTMAFFYAVWSTLNWRNLFTLRSSIYRVKKGSIRPKFPKRNSQKMHFLVCISQMLILSERFEKKKIQTVWIKCVCPNTQTQTASPLCPTRDLHPSSKIHFSEVLISEVLVSQASKSLQLSLDFEVKACMQLGAISLLWWWSGVGFLLLQF